MRTLLILLFSAVACLAQPVFPPAFWAPATGAAAPPSYNFTEEWESGQGTWVKSGTGDAAYTIAPAPLVGTKSAMIQSTASASSFTTNLSIGSEMDIYCKFNVTNSSDANIVLSWRDNSTVIGNITFATANGMTVFNGNSANATTVTAPSVGTTYHVWAHWKKGTGSNGTMDIAFSTTGTRPVAGNNFASASNGTATTDITKLRFGGGSGNTSTIVVDHILVIYGSSRIGDNP